MKDVMKKLVRKGQFTVIVIPVLLLILFLIDRISLSGSRILLLSGSLVLFLVYTFILVVLLPYFQSEKQSSFIENMSDDETLPSLLIPVEDESDLGELIEVDSNVPSFQPFISEQNDSVQEEKAPVPISMSFEPLEELEVYEEPIEELEAVEE